MKNYRNRSIGTMRRKQQGFVTLIASLMLMFLITFNVFMGAKGSIVEQQTATNMYASDIAFNHAEEGIATMIAKIKAGKATDPIAIADKYQVTYNLFSDPITNITTGTIVSVGKGPMGAERTVTQRLIIVVTPGILDHNASSLNALGDVNISGSMTVTSINAGGNNAVVGNGASVDFVTTNSPDFQVKVVGADGSVITDSLGNALTRLMTPGEQFMFYYGTNFCPVAKAANAPENCIAEAKIVVAGSKNNKGTDKETDKGYVCDAGCGNNFDTKYAAGIRYFWVTNGMTINAHTIVGSDTDPVFIFIMDNSAIKINGTAEIHGYLYVYVPATTPYGSGSEATPVVIEVLGGYDMSGTGNSLIQGALITSGNISGQGNGKLLGGGNGGGSGSRSVIETDPLGWSDML